MGPEARFLIYVETCSHILDLENKLPHVLAFRNSHLVEGINQGFLWKSEAGFHSTFELEPGVGWGVAYD